VFEETAPAGAGNAEVSDSEWPDRAALPGGLHGWSTCQPVGQANLRLREVWSLHTTY